MGRRGWEVAEAVLVRASGSLGLRMPGATGRLNGAEFAERLV